MSNFWNVAKPIIEAGALGALLILTVRLWLKTTSMLEESTKQRVMDEKEHSKEIMKLQAEHNREMTELVRQYDGTLTAVHSTLRSLTLE